MNLKGSVFHSLYYLCKSQLLFHWDMLEHGKARFMKVKLYLSLNMSATYEVYIYVFLILASSHVLQYQYSNRKSKGDRGYV